MVKFIKDLNCFQLFFLVVINVRSRELIYIGLTLNPNRGWLIQQFKNIAIDEIDFPHFLIIDNDGIYGKWIDPIFGEYFEIKTLRIDIGCPWQNGICERFMRTFKSDLLYRIPISDINHLYRIIQAYRNYYNRVRPHQGIKGNVPQNMKQRIERINNLADIKIKKVSHIYGLFTEFSLAA